MSPTAPVPATYRVTFDDWLRYPDDGKIYEVIEGELFVSPPPAIRHQRIARNLLRHIDPFLQTRSTGEVLFAPVGVRFSEDNVLEPDLVVILGPRLARGEESALDGAPDLVVEILSPGTAGRDLGAKRAVYERFGVPEYWIVDPIAATIQVLALTDGAYREAALYRRDQTLLSPLLAGLEIPLAKVF